MILSCPRRRKLFEELVESLVITDFARVCKKWLVVSEPLRKDDNLDDYLHGLQGKFPVLEFIIKTEKKPGQAASMNLILRTVRADPQLENWFWLHLEENWIWTGAELGNPCTFQDILHLMQHKNIDYGILST